MTQQTRRLQQVARQVVTHRPLSRTKVPQQLRNQATYEMFDFVLYGAGWQRCCRAVSVCRAFFPEQVGVAARHLATHPLFNTPLGLLQRFLRVLFSGHKIKQ